jgi:NAD(P)-dependent dehydrogenase (short-subunit alcohol dehydrogenase family)
MAEYGVSKLANVLFTYEMARRLADTAVTCNAVDPGMVNTDFARQATPLYRVLFALTRPLRVPPERGARTSVYVASSAEVAGVTGKYFADRRAVRSSPASYDAALARRLWEVSEAMVGSRF